MYVWTIAVQIVQIHIAISVAWALVEKSLRNSRSVFRPPVPRVERLYLSKNQR
jgi:hypothetical protein